MLQQNASLLLQHLKDLKAQGLTSFPIDYPAFSQLVQKLSSSSTPPSIQPTQPSERPSLIPLAKDTPSAPAHIPEAPKPQGPPPPSFELPIADKQTQWDFLKNLVLNDPQCKAHLRPGKQIVFGEGSLDADILFCGDAPGPQEESLGKPFIDEPGLLLAKIIQAMGLTLQSVYLTNIMNWRPEATSILNNRPPSQTDMQYCLPYLKAQIDIIKPKVIIALGATTLNGLLGKDPKRRMGDVRGQWLKFNDTPLMITFHPSYLLSNGSLKTKRTVWEDILNVMAKVNLPISDKQKSFFLPK